MASEIHTSESAQREAELHSSCVISCLDLPIIFRSSCFFLRVYELHAVGAGISDAWDAEEGHFMYSAGPGIALPDVCLARNRGTMHGAARCREAVRGTNKDERDTGLRGVKEDMPDLP